MKKLALLLSMALLAACGGGGSSTTTTTTQSASYSTDNGQLPMATMSVSIAGNETTAQQKTLALGPLSDLSETNRLRIVISNPNVRLNNAAFKSISTHLFPTSGISYTLPVAPGYKIEAISFKQTIVPGVNRLKRYGSATFNMTPTGSDPATVSISPVGIDAKIAFAQYSSTFPLASLTAYVTTTPTYKSQYNIAVSGRTAPLGTMWKLVRESADIPTRSSYSGISVSSDLLTAMATPQSYSGGAIYALGEFYLDSFYLKADETPVNFSYIYPNRYWNDPPVSQTYAAPLTGTGGGITIVGGW